MENPSSEIYFMQHLASISHQKIYPSLQSKNEMPLLKTLHVTRLWNQAREKEMYLTQQKNDWWIHQMMITNTSNQLLNNKAWLEDDLTTTRTNDNDDDDDDDDIDINTTHPIKEQPDTIKDHTSLLSHTPLWTDDDLVSILTVTQDRKRKFEDDSTCQTPPPANRSPMLKV